MGLQSSLIRRGATYVWRRRLPAQLGGKLIQTSLRSNDPDIAKRIAPVVTAESWHMYWAMMFQTLTKDDVRTLVTAVIQRELHRCKQTAKKISEDLREAETTQLELTTMKRQAEEHAGQALESIANNKKMANQLAAEKAEFDEGITALTELVDQIDEGRANTTDNRINMANPPHFLRRLFSPEQPKTKTTNLFRKFIKVLKSAVQTRQI